MMELRVRRHTEWIEARGLCLFRWIGPTICGRFSNNLHVIISDCTNSQPPPPPENVTNPRNTKKIFANIKNMSRWRCTLNFGNTDRPCVIAALWDCRVGNRPYSQTKTSNDEITSYGPWLQLHGRLVCLNTSYCLFSSATLRPIISLKSINMRSIVSACCRHQFL
jgi:hypothetical protein